MPTKQRRRNFASRRGAAAQAYFVYVKPLQRSIGGKYPAESRETGPRRSLLIYPPGGLGYHTAVEIMFYQAPLAWGSVPPLCHSEPVLTLAWESVSLRRGERIATSLRSSQ